jgi:hypothetical protein
LVFITGCKHSNSRASSDVNPLDVCMKCVHGSKVMRLF